MTIALFAAILISGIALFFMRETPRLRLILVMLLALFHFGVTLSYWHELPPALFGGVLRLDDLGRFFLTIISLLFFLVTIYCYGHLRLEEHHDQNADKEGNEASLLGTMVLFLGAMTLVTFCQNIELLWVAIEATTLASAPLIYYSRTPSAIEATWKYLMICSVGIGLALLGNFFIAASLAHLNINITTLQLEDFMAKSPQLHMPWIKAGFLLILIGYGTKAGLAPFHSWLPSSYSEAPSFVSTLLSGALSNCALIGIIRTFQLCQAAGLSDFATFHFKVFGILSLFFAAGYMLVQTDYKRLLAYSSVEHMGVTVIGLGLGSQAIWGSMFHALNSSLTKGMLFLLTGNILTAYKTRSIRHVSGLSDRMPVTGTLWLIGLFALSGMPPFGMFYSKFIILRTAVAQGQLLFASTILLLVTTIFIGMAITFTHMYHGHSESEEGIKDPSTALIKNLSRKEPFWSIAPPFALLILIILLGVYLPMPLAASLNTIAEVLGKK